MFTSGYDTITMSKFAKNRSRVVFVVVVHDIASFYTYFTLLKIAEILN